MIKLNTKYLDVIELAVHIMENFKLQDLILTDNKEMLIQTLKPYIKYASAELEINSAEFSISDRNDVLEEFNSSLTDGQQLIVAKLIVVGILSFATNNILQMQLHLQDGDFKTYAEKNNLDGKLNALYTLKEEIGYNLTRIGYKNFKW